MDAHSGPMFPAICLQVARAIGKKHLLPSPSLDESKQLLPLNIVIMEKKKIWKIRSKIEYSTYDISLTDLLIDKHVLEPKIKESTYCSYNPESTYSLKGTFQAGINSIIGATVSASAQGALTSKLGDLLQRDIEYSSFLSALNNRKLDMNHHFIKEIKDTKQVLCVIRGVITTSDKAEIKRTNKTEGNIKVSEKVMGNIDAGIEAAKSSVGEMVIGAGTTLAYKVWKLQVDVDSGAIIPIITANMNGGFFKNKNLHVILKLDEQICEPLLQACMSTEYKLQKHEVFEENLHVILKLDKEICEPLLQACMSTEYKPQKHEVFEELERIYPPQLQACMSTEYKPLKFEVFEDEDQVKESSEESLREHSGGFVPIDENLHVILPEPEQSYSPQLQACMSTEYKPRKFEVFEDEERKESNSQFNWESLYEPDEDEVEESSSESSEESLRELSGEFLPIDDEERKESNSQFNCESLYEPDDNEVEESSSVSSEESLRELSGEFLPIDDEVAATLQNLRDILQPLRDCTEADSRAIKSLLLDLMTCYSDVVAMSKILSKAENGTINEDKDSLDEQFINSDTVWSILTFVGVQTEKGRVLYEREATPIFIAVAYMIDVILELKNDDLENIYHFDEPQLKTLSKIFESAVASSETISIDVDMSSVLKEPVSSFLTRQKFTVCNDSIQPPKAKTCMLEDIFCVLYCLS